MLDGTADLGDAETTAGEIGRHFPSADLASIGDEIADGLWTPQRSAERPLTLFDGLRTDFSLARLAHYTGGPVENVQAYVLFTNYHRYVDEFIRWGATALADPKSRFERLACPGGAVITRETRDPERAAAESPWRRHQMPAYHLIADDRRGVSLINIGVGPSNAKTITDHLAVLRPEAWLMIGHCGGLRSTQTIGDYVLAHAYLRDDKVLDAVLPPEIPIPPIAEVQVALQRAAEVVTGETGDELKKRLRTGTIVTTDDRNWELHYTRSALRYNQSRAVAIDMESATIAAQGYRFRTPYGTLLHASPISRSTARSSCPVRPTRSTNAPSRNICGSASRPWTCCAKRVRVCTHVSCAASTNRHSGKDRRGSELGGEAKFERARVVADEEVVAVERVGRLPVDPVGQIIDRERERVIPELVEYRRVQRVLPRYHE